LEWVHHCPSLVSSHLSLILLLLLSSLTFLTKSTKPFKSTPTRQLVRQHTALAPFFSSRSTMVSPTSSWTATPLLILLLSSTTYAQYTLRGRVVQDHHKHALGRRAEPAARPSDSGADESAAGGDGADTSEAGGDDSENPAGPEASSSTQSDKGDEGDAASGDEVSAGSDGPPAVCPPFSILEVADE
jgi:hypothetical protein